MVCLSLYIEPSVCVRVVDIPGRRLGIEVTTQDDVGLCGDVM